MNECVLTSTPHVVLQVLMLLQLCVCAKDISSFDACCQLASVEVWRSRTVSLDLSFLHTKQLLEQSVQLTSQNQGVIYAGIKLLARGPSYSVVPFLSLLKNVVSSV